MPDKKPNTIVTQLKPNFDVLSRAFEAGDAGMILARREIDGKEVVLLCAISREAEGGASFAPFAEMIYGNPYEMYSIQVHGKKDSPTLLGAILKACRDMLRTHAPTINGYCKICHHYGQDCQAHKLANAICAYREKMNEPETEDQKEDNQEVCPTPSQD